MKQLQCYYSLIFEKPLTLLNVIVLLFQINAANAMNKFKTIYNFTLLKSLLGITLKSRLEIYPIHFMFTVSDYIRHNPRRKSRGESDSSPEKPVTRACNVEALSEIKQLYDCMISSDNGASVIFRVYVSSYPLSLNICLESVIV